jgi:hypothetical protein
MTIAQTIAEQIGRPAFAMMGAKNIVAGERDLTFKVGANAKKVTHVRVTLDPSDTYSVEFIRVGRNYSVTTLASVALVHVEQLRSTIEANTGLYLSL